MPATAQRLAAADRISSRRPRAATPSPRRGRFRNPRDSSGFRSERRRRSRSLYSSGWTIPVRAPAKLSAALPDRHSDRPNNEPDRSGTYRPRRSSSSRSEHCNKRANHADGRRFPASATDQYASAVTPDHRPIQRIIAARAPSNGCLVPHGIRYPASCAEIRRHRRARLWQDARGLCLEPAKQRGKERRVRPQTFFYHVY